MYEPQYETYRHGLCLLSECTQLLPGQYFNFFFPTGHVPLSNMTKPNKVQNIRKHEAPENNE
jgi:hypothetical protein